jgi:hypothetical protein
MVHARLNQVHRVAPAPLRVQRRACCTPGQARRVAESSRSRPHIAGRGLPAPRHPRIQKLVRRRLTIPHEDPFHAAQSLRIDDQEAPVVHAEHHVMGELVLHDRVHASQVGSWRRAYRTTWSRLTMP